MIVESIFVSKNEIQINVPELEQGSSAVVRAFVPLVCGTNANGKVAGRCVFESANAQNGGFILPRYIDRYDLLICRFEIEVEGNKLDGVRYATDLSDDFSKDRFEFTVKKPVGTWVTSTEEDIDLLGFGCMMNEFNTAWIQTVSPKEDDIAHEWNGKTYYFDREFMQLYDELMIPCVKRKIPCLIRLINRFSYRLCGSDDALVGVIGHPDYEPTGFNEQMSAFNIRTEEGLDMYCACIDFLCARYADPKSPLFCSTVMDIGNEINAQNTWHNCGRMSCADYMEEYTEQLRLAHLIARKYNASFRVDVSFDHNFADHILEPDRMRHYPSRDCLAYLAAYCKRDGDFDWGISAHPYPEDLSHPDFYHDKTATFSFDSTRITMKNLEVWQELVELPELTYRGKPRRVVFDEQGFHTNGDDPEAENKGAYAFVLAYLKLRKCENIDWFIINRYADMPLDDESGLHLGIRYEKGYADPRHILITPGDYKKICYAIRDMETADEKKWIAEAREYVGEELFDFLLSPPAPEKIDYFKNISNSI